MNSAEDKTNKDKSEENKTNEENKADRQAKLLLMFIGFAGCLLFACGIGIMLGWGWFLAVIGLAMLLFFALALLGFSLEGS